MSDDKLKLQASESMASEKPEKGDTSNSQTARNGVSDGESGEPSETSDGMSVLPPAAVPPEPPPIMPQEAARGETTMLDTVCFT